MKSICRTGIPIVMILGLAALTQSPASAADVAAGKALFATKCRACHGPDGVPSAPMVKAMGMKPMNDPAIQGKSDEALKDSILKGIGKMKPQAVSPADADNLVAVVRGLK